MAVSEEAKRREYSHRAVDFELSVLELSHPLIPPRDRQFDLVAPRHPHGRLKRLTKMAEVETEAAKLEPRVFASPILFARVIR